MNKKFRMMIGMMIATVAHATPTIAADVGISIGIGQPGFYGQIDIGDAPRPRIIYAEPRIIERVIVEQEPIYLRVRPGQSRNWARYCGQYNACDRRVYFVNETYYNNVYSPHYRKNNRGHNDNGHHGGHDNDRGRKHRK